MYFIIARLQVCCSSLSCRPPRTFFFKKCFLGGEGENPTGLPCAGGGGVLPAELGDALHRRGHCLSPYASSTLACSMAASLICAPDIIVAICVTRSSAVRRFMFVRPPSL